MPLHKKAAVFLLPAGISLLLFINLCNGLFQCGCRSWWNGAERFCNIHTPGAAHCPWCSYGWNGVIVPLGLIWAVQAGITFMPGNLSWTQRLLLGFLAFLAVGALVGFVFAVYSDYPTFLFLRTG